MIKVKISFLLILLSQNILAQEHTANHIYDQSYFINLAEVISHSAGTSLKIHSNNTTDKSTRLSTNTAFVFYIISVISFMSVFIICYKNLPNKTLPSHVASTDMLALRMNFQKQIEEMENTNAYREDKLIAMELKEIKQQIKEREHEDYLIAKELRLRIKAIEDKEAAELQLMFIKVLNICICAVIVSLFIPSSETSAHTMSPKHNSEYHK